MYNQKDYDQWLLHSACKATNHPNGRTLRRKERKLERKVKKRLDEQRDYVITEGLQLLEQFSEAQNNPGAQEARLPKMQTKDFRSELEQLFEEMPDEELIQDIIDEASEAMKFGADYRIDSMDLGELGITFTLDHPLANAYLRTDRPLLLSKMSDTVKELIMPILLEAQAEGRSPQETAREIRENFAFSRSRALMIATNEIGHAYEWGNYIPMKALQDNGYIVEKRWLTVNDDAVTEECASYQAKGWIPLSQDFDSRSTQDDMAPRDSNPRCRCTTLYQFDE